MQSKKIHSLNGVQFNITVNYSFTANGMEECSISIDSAVVNGREVSAKDGILECGIDMEQVMDTLGKSLKNKQYGENQ